jgi:hypothetical protein
MVQVQAQGTVQLRGAAYTVASPGMVQVQAQGKVKLRGAAYTSQSRYGTGTGPVYSKAQGSDSYTQVQVLEQVKYSIRERLFSVKFWSAQRQFMSTPGLIQI